MHSILVRVALSSLFLLVTSLAFAHLTTDSTDIPPPDDWFHLDPTASDYPGISTEQAYQFIGSKPARKVIVAVIDSGIDSAHEDLAGRLWVNSDEIAGNGRDDDNNGYVDDIHGWNFIGGSDGTNVDNDTYELTREYVRLRRNQQSDRKKRRDEEYYETIVRTYRARVAELEQQRMQFVGTAIAFRRFKQLFTAYLGVDTLTVDTLQTVQSPDPLITEGQRFMTYALQAGIDEKGIDEAEAYFKSALDYGYDTTFNTRTIVGDNYADLSQRDYGNRDVTGPDATHGTHVAGIIAANRNNTLGGKGIAEPAEIMIVRAVPDGDERDKDVANAIYYAVDNGANIINMSFGKSYSPDKTVVDEAVRYAQAHNVLLVHAAGNDGKSVDKTPNFPNASLNGEKIRAPNWIEVGASSWKLNDGLPAEFSNYGKKNVDVFAPGVDIYSATPNDGYAQLNGTSMAAPVVSGVAALLMAYFPDLTAEEVRDIILESAIPYRDLAVKRPGDEKETKFSSLSTTGGVVNALEAVKMAAARTTK
jgi:subtilisin family serine protease